ncbi:hypothetical protein [Magnetovibrio blakemorei]|uniref:hypothetical protein n=1 Tax=Magnetovibrio blakemorei TaxID=28181 RepID=UPI001112F96F|nr:hypothetical protein [Magnetovibrio blakemorei]
MRYQEIITEIISTPLSPTISYDAKSNRLNFDDERGTPRLGLKHVHRIKLLRRRYLKQQAQLRQLRGLMYGGSLSVKQTEVAAAQAELEAIQHEIQTLERQRDNRDDVMSMAMDHIKRKY